MTSSQMQPHAKDVVGRRAEIVVIGDELLSGETVDTNSNFLDRRLESWGWTVTRHTTVVDDVEAIASALREASARADLILTSGGLGPTEDDLTLEACAVVQGVGLRLDEPTLARIEERFRKYGREMTPNNRRQAMVPEEGEVLENEVGTAPGFTFQLGQARVFVLPGVPREVFWLTDNTLAPRLNSGTPAIVRRTVKIIGFGESRLEHTIREIVESHRSRVRFGYRALGFENHIKLAVDMDKARNAAQSGAVDLATTWLDDVERALREQLGDRIVGCDDEDYISVLATRLLATGSTLATAESCTGGLMGKLLTDRAGSSSYYLGGVVTYSNESKVELLGVDPETLEEEGAVSEPVAGQMADGVRERLGADYGLSATGVAGPTGGTEEKPVGLVYVGLSGPEGTEVKELHSVGDREMNRLNTAKFALDWLRRHLQVP